MCHLERSVKTTLTKNDNFASKLEVLKHYVSTFEKFKKIQFFYIIDVDDDELRLNNVFWMP